MEECQIVTIKEDEDMIISPDSVDCSEESVLPRYCGGLHLVINIYFMSCVCLANYGASEAVYPCVVVEKIHECFLVKNAPMYLEINQL